ncbi:MAG: hypothetical protein ACT4QC_22160 [Planctomycetaceae bacterium]
MTATRHAYIPDGYTRAAKVAGCEFHPPLVFEFRPMLSVDRATFRHRVARLAPEGLAGVIAAEHIAAGELAARLTAWTLTDHEGALVPISREHVLRVELHLLAKVAEIVLGLAPGADEREAADEKN